MHALNQKKILIIIPVLNEQRVLEENFSAYEKIRSLKNDHYHVSLIFVDGGSHDKTIEVLKKKDFKVIISGAGRAKQQNFGASYVNDFDTVIFLHADTYFVNALENYMDYVLKGGWGFFKLQLSNNGFIYRMIAKTINWRSLICKRATGDQVLFFSRAIYEELSGFKQIALMEDIEITSRARKISSPRIGPYDVQTSARRWEKNGPIKTIVSMWFFQMCFAFGVSSERIADWYYPDSK